MIDAVNDLALLMRSRHSLIHIETVEEERAREILARAAQRVELPFFLWRRTSGLRRLDATGEIYDSKDLGSALAHIRASPLQAVYHFPGIGPDLSPPLVREQFREALASVRLAKGTIFLTGSDVTLPPELDHVATAFTLPCPSETELRALLEHLVRDLTRTEDVEVRLTPAELGSLLTQLQGLTLMEAEKVLTKAIIEDGILAIDDLRHVIAAKKEIIEREGLLEYYPLEESLAEIADLKNLKAWLSKRTAVVRDPRGAERFGLEFPKGVLLLGVPGCGKSLCAKAVATEWQLPLLKLDPSNLYDKYIGESERNFRRAMDAAERMAPVVLWIDELEKAFAPGGSDDGGVSARILGTFLSWMQDRRGDVFVVATANQISRIPPELLRKGRFDEIFFVDLPDAHTRAEILRIHLTARNQTTESFDLVAHATAMDGFSGAEIEQAIVSGLFAAFADGSTLDSARLASEIVATVPLARTMAEKISEMRRWAEGRAVRAN